MNSGMVLALIILAVLVASLLYIMQAEGGFSEIPRVLKRVGISVPEPTATPTPSPEKIAPASFTSGDSRFSQGTCIRDSDCRASGCSGEVCGVEEAISTCEFSEDFPNVQGYSCGCVKGHCGWR